MDIPTAFAWHRVRPSLDAVARVALVAGNRHITNRKQRKGGKSNQNQNNTKRGTVRKATSEARGNGQWRMEGAKGR